MRGVRLQGALADVMSACQELPSDLRDRDLAPDLEVAERLLREHAWGG
jgi:hypothetical protein